ncbi:MAG: hypothetical protein IJU26_02420 [Synergistaceae bacterium]|nr:hypothetical protein [Synergistaceae bacterium]
MTTLRSLLRLNDGTKPSVIEQLKRDNLPIVMWGAGDVAFHTIRTLRKKGINLSCIWVDGNASGEFYGVPIRSYEQIAAQFSTFNVVCGHSRFDLAEAAEKSHKEINRIFCSANACYEDSDIMTSEFIEEHYSEYERSFELLEDDFSRQCFAAYLNCRNNDDYTMLLPCCVNLRTGGGAKKVTSTIHSSTSAILKYTLM